MNSALGLLAVAHDRVASGDVDPQTMIDELLIDVQAPLEHARSNLSGAFDPIAMGHIENGLARLESLLQNLKQRL